MPRATALGPSERVRPCPGCGFFAYYCCVDPYTFCHYRSVVFTDGACINNGQKFAAGGYGVAVGAREDQQYSQPFEHALPKTSERAKLMGAIAGTDKAIVWNLCGRTSGMESGAPLEDKKEVIVMTDSEYVVKGMTEWLPQWKKKGFKNTKGKVPANLDLFLQIESRIEQMDDINVAIRFLHVPRKQNRLADKLAKSAAELDRLHDRLDQIVL